MITVVVLLILAGVSIAMLTGDNGILTQAKLAKEKTEEAKVKEEQQLESLLNKITSEIASEEGYNESKNVNSPKVTTGMIPIKYNGTDRVVCSKEDPEWYNYDDTKRWANVMLSDGKYKEGKEYTTNQDVDTRTTAIVHPAFNLAGGRLSGIWVAKFEASGTGTLATGSHWYKNTMS